MQFIYIYIYIYIYRRYMMIIKEHVIVYFIWFINTFNPLLENIYRSGGLNDSTYCTLKVENRSFITYEEYVRPHNPK
jgi:hypothetical protein